MSSVESAISRFEKFLKLPVGERLLIAKGFLVLATIRSALLILPFSWIRKPVAVLGQPRRPIPGAGRPGSTQVIWALVAASRFVPGGTNCLARALAAKVMLGRLGYVTELKIGAQKTSEGKIEAHAWLESDGKILLGRFEPGQYVTMTGNSAVNI